MTGPDSITTVEPVGSPTSAFPADAPVSEPAWQAWSEHLAPLRPEPWRRAVVVAPHPDDETLGCGGLVRDLVRRGVEVQVVTVTDGEGSHRGWPDLAVERRREQQAALQILGVSSQPTFLAIPDGRVSEHERELAAALGELLLDADVVLAPWAHDGHTDHDAIGRVAARTGGSVGVEVVAHPIWAWQWAQLDDLSGPPWQRWQLSAETSRVKAAALDAHRSQISDEHGPAVLGPDVIARVRRSYEVHARVG